MNLTLRSLEATLKRGMELNAYFVEVYESDADNPAHQEILKKYDELMRNK